jgi:hypothetical protein
VTDAVRQKLGWVFSHGATAMVSAAVAVGLWVARDRISIEARVSLNTEHLVEVDRRLTQHDEQFKLLIEHDQAMLALFNKGQELAQSDRAEIRMRLGLIEQRLKMGMRATEPAPAPRAPTPGQSPELPPLLPAHGPQIPLSGRGLHGAG